MTEISANLPVKDVRFSPETWHEYFKTRFLGADDMRLPNGKVLTIPKSTSDLDRGEFAEYSTQVEAWAADHGVWLDE